MTRVGGIGVCTPGTYDLTTYRFEGDGKNGPEGSAFSYFAPIRTMPLQPGWEFTYEIFLAIGTLDELRGTFKRLSGGESRAPAAKDGAKKKRRPRHPGEPEISRWRTA